MTLAEVAHPNVTTAHQAKWAFVYVRQSSLAQVTRHTESTDLQYQLVERATQLGWPRERIQVIDDDLGKSGASSEERRGFQRLMAEIGLARAGLVVSLDASRLARNNGDWYQLLELCSVFGTLIADSERLYDPGAYHDRLLLGLSGMMSEAELHHLKLRLHAGAQHKAERGALRLPLPAGLARPYGGDVTLNPDEEVQARLQLVFEKFRELRTAKGVVRYLRSQELPLPTRPLRGPAPHEIIWQPATSSLVLGILKNPAYAGAYVYGRHTHDPARRKPGRPGTGCVRVAIEQWPVVLYDRHPGYITWEEFLANQAQLRMNQARYQDGKTGAARKGQALLQGIARCGRCGARMALHYSGPHGEFPVYVCIYRQRQEGGPRCQEVRALSVDAEIERVVLEALAPDKIAIALAALEQLEQEDERLRKQWQLRLERASYEAERARRQYDAVEPENRLVARSLERLWEEKLREGERVAQEYEGWLRQQVVTLTAEDQRDILALGEDLPRVWRAPTTTAADRKHLLRLLVKDVILDHGRAQGKVWMQINWQTGATSEHWVTRRVSAYGNYAELPRLQERLRELTAEQKMDDEIAATLNAEGFQTAHGYPFSGKLIWLLRNKWELPTVSVKATYTNPARWEDGSYSVDGAAAVLGVYPGTVYHWLKVGRLHGRQLAKGMPWQIPLDDEQVASLQGHLARARRSRRVA
jgi:DNA invertase Pin-like site-specific DNA recombinase